MTLSLSKIWIYWDHGIEAAPPLVRACIASCVRKNADMDVCILDDSNLSDYIAIPSTIDVGKLPVQKKSNLVRLLLLLKYGGIWSDATVFHVTPLSSWLSDGQRGRYFSFANPHPSRLSATWFIAADMDSEILYNLAARHLEIFSMYRFRNQETALGQSLLKDIEPHLTASPQASLLYLSEVLLGTVGVYPYFLFHYLFNACVLTNEACRNEWAAVVKMGAAEPMKLQNLHPDTDAALSFIANRGAPLFKLDWRADLGTHYWKEVMAALEVI